MSMSHFLYDTSASAELPATAWPALLYWQGKFLKICCSLIFFVAFFFFFIYMTGQVEYDDSPYYQFLHM